MIDLYSRKPFTFCKLLGCIWDIIFHGIFTGPYSITLTKDGFALIDKYYELPLVRFVKAEDETLFRKFQIFLVAYKV